MYKSSIMQKTSQSDSRYHIIFGSLTPEEVKRSLANFKSKM